MGFKHFRQYLHDRKFTIVTDTTHLTWIFNVEDLSSRLFRWRLKLEEYDYDIVYKPATSNTNADAFNTINMTN